VVEEVEVADFL